MVSVIHVPAGTVIRGIESPGYVTPGSLVETPFGDGGIRNVEQIKEKSRTGLISTAAGTNYIYSSSLSAGEKAEVGSLIDISKKEMMIVLPDNGYFDSFAGRNREAVSLQLIDSMSDAHPGWLLRNLKSAVRKILMDRLARQIGRDVQVCGIFNNGDSACFEVNTVAPSADKFIAGSAKDKTGAKLADAGGGGGSGLNVNYNPPEVGFGGRGSSGRTGELWLFCSSIGGKLVSCYTRVL